MYILSSNKEKSKGYWLMFDRPINAKIFFNILYVSYSTLLKSSFDFIEYLMVPNAFEFKKVFSLSSFIKSYRNISF